LIPEYGNERKRIFLISYISGKLTQKTPTWIVVETGGMGFHISIPISSYDALGETGREVRVLTHLHVREDALQLWGFATESEKRLFLLLISVSGIGPKLAQGILSGISVADFEEAVRNQDLSALTRVPGIGKKTAERLVLELKDKIGEETVETHRELPSQKVPTEEEAILALVSLGYKHSQAQEAVRKILKLDPLLPLEETLRRALRLI
jgi:Holliday junction DNA helicase RuvA